ncbi:hypothetical protein A1O3_08827, partial [Capronia epimyces CBS 606.96]
IGGLAPGSLYVAWPKSLAQQAGTPTSAFKTQMFKLSRMHMRMQVPPRHILRHTAARPRGRKNLV